MRSSNPIGLLIGGSARRLAGVNSSLAAGTGDAGTLLLPEPGHRGGGRCAADRWLAGVAERRGAVLGHCVGAVYAAEVAARVACGQATPPEVLLFDPQPPDAGGLLAEFPAASANLGPLLHDEWAALRPAGDNAAENCGDRLVPVLRGWTATGSERTGIETVLGAETCDVFRRRAAAARVRRRPRRPAAQPGGRGGGRPDPGLGTRRGGGRMSGQRSGSGRSSCGRFGSGRRRSAAEVTA